MKKPKLYRYSESSALIYVDILVYSENKDSAIPLIRKRLEATIADSNEVISDEQIKKGLKRVKNTKGIIHSEINW